jgi:DMSO/TMAO reductase YedYZ molybdopterin-dependent catalytic subunit
MRKPGILLGALLGLILTVPATAVFYLAWQLADLPFPPFELFDWLARALPGGLVTFGIDTLVSVILALGFAQVSEVAKVAEQSLALVIFVLLGGLAGGLLFAGIYLFRARLTYLPSLIFGALAGLAVALVSWSVRGELFLWHAGWTVLLSLGWGMALGWAHAQLQKSSSHDTEDDTGASAVRLDRRRFLIQLGSATAVITVTGMGLGALLGRERDREGLEAVLAERPWSATHRLPNADAKVMPVAGTRPELTPLEDHYRIDINTTPPRVDEASWRLKVSGLVERELELSLDELKAYPAMHQFVTLSCISNRIAGDLIGTQRWTGVSLQRLLPDLGLKEEASHLVIRAVDGFHEVVSLEDIHSDERVMLVYAWDGLPLSYRNGFPLRIYIPDVYGMKQPKWIESIEATDSWEAGYWVRRSWSREAIMKATSVIDTVALDARFDQNGQTLVPIGGIAHAGARGISRVQVQVDDGEWLDAKLRQPLSETTWAIWRFDWPFREGEHTFAVRCFDGQGKMQVLEESSVRPDGATGVHRVRASL